MDINTKSAVIKSPITDNILVGNDFILFPNPAKSFINVNYLRLPVFKTRIEIFNSRGRLILNQLVQSTSSKIDIGQYPSGLYFIRSVNIQRSIVKKFIVE